MTMRTACAMAGNPGMAATRLLRVRLPPTPAPVIGRSYSTEPGPNRESAENQAPSTGWASLIGQQRISLNWARGGIGLQVSADRLHFKPVFSQPLMLTAGGDWGRKDGLELVSYPVVIDAQTGLNQLGDHWLLAYMYLNTGEGFDKRYLIFRPVDISWSRSPSEPIVPSA